MTRMFTAPGGVERMKTWNVFVGCLFNCTYCSARKLALTRLKTSERYKEGFDPHFVWKELGRRFRDGTWCFLCYMGDISWAGAEAVKLIIEKVESMPGVSFLMLTKDPSCYLRWQEEWGFEAPSNLYLGATIESNIDHGVTKAPPPEKRYEAMRDLQHDKKFISMEPILSFDLGTLLGWMKQVKPCIIEVGADNYHHKLPEPESWILRRFIEDLRAFCPNVIEKNGLDRLLKGERR